MVPIKVRLQVLVGLLLLFIVLYKGVQSLSQVNPLFTISLMLPGEVRIPFLPHTLIIYCLAYFLPFLPFLVVRRIENFVLMVWVFMITTMLHLLIFLVLPIPYTLRPTLDPESSSGILWWVAQFYRIDLPLNCFPSLHVSLSFLCYFITRRRRPWLSYPVLFIVLAICVSTFVLKQHYVLDAAAAFMIALVMDQWLIRPGIPLSKRRLILRLKLGLLRPKIKRQNRARSW